MKPLFPSLLAALLILCPTLAWGQLAPDEIPDVCQELDQVRVGTGTRWSVMSGNTATLVAGTDSARVYTGPGPDRIWVCKVEGETYVSSGVFGVYQTTSPVQIAMMRRVTRDRTSPWSTVVYDHPLRAPAGIVIAREDSVRGLQWANLPTTEVWR